MMIADMDQDDEACLQLPGIDNEDDWTCSMDCKDRISSMIDEFDCCVTWILDFFEEDEEGEGLENFVTVTCGLEIPPPCPPEPTSAYFWILEFSIPIPNLDCDWAETEIETQLEVDADNDGNADNDSVILDSILIDVGYELGIPKERFEFAGITCDGKGTVVNFELVTTNKAETDRVQAALVGLNDAHLITLTDLLNDLEDSDDPYVDEEDSDFNAGDPSVDIERYSNEEEDGEGTRKTRTTKRTV
eukprot:TRINITY_DN5108_c0_g1_i1.p1 TRINITY_DN5108_c0_g1~~TRINITY_DN5108_c0_g1_i1.p1  ORF type:complete len:246 (+),score=50.21 TRINITY_DN5108_c0_g1_i1:121-858(+)